MNEASRRRTIRSFPSWLAFWLVVYLISLPEVIRDLWLPAMGEVLSPSFLPGEDLIPSSWSFRFSNVAELAPSLLLLLGVISLGFPGLRGRRNREAYGLSDPPDLPVMAEIRAFLAVHTPGLEMRTNLLRTDSLAFITPLGWRRQAMAVFGGLVTLWRRDREAAQAVLLHEIAHTQQGDAFATGVGSAFKALLNVWLPLTLGWVVLPMMLVWGLDAVRFLNQTGVPLQEGLSHKLIQWVASYLPGLSLAVGGALLASLGTILLPLAGLWCAEFYADHAAVAVLGASAPLLRILREVGDSTSRGRWLISAMTHPLAGMRRWLANRAFEPYAEVLLLLLFPLTYLVKGALLLLRAWSAYLMVGSAGDVIRAALRGHGADYVRTLTPVWIVIIGLLLVWPWLAPGISRAPSARSDDHEIVYVPYALAVLGLIGLAVVMRFLFL